MKAISVAWIWFVYADIAVDKVERVSEFRHERKKEKKMEEIWVRSVVEQKNKR